MERARTGQLPRIPRKRERGLAGELVGLVLGGLYAQRPPAAVVVELRGHAQLEVQALLEDLDELLAAALVDQVHQLKLALQREDPGQDVESALRAALGRSLEEGLPRQLEQPVDFRLPGGEAAVA